jgi:hypothetical protein
MIVLAEFLSSRLLVSGGSLYNNCEQALKITGPAGSIRAKSDLPPSRIDALLYV